MSCGVCWWCGLDPTLEENLIKMQCERDEARAQVAAMREKAEALVSGMDTCHICLAMLIVDGGLARCEDCSSDCEDHEEPNCSCASLKVLHGNLKAALASDAGRQWLEEKQRTADTLLACQERVVELEKVLTRLREGMLVLLELRKIPGMNRYGALTREEIEGVVAEIDSVIKGTA